LALKRKVKDKKKRESSVHAAETKDEENMLKATRSAKAGISHPTATGCRNLNHVRQFITHPQGS
jgi:hypothetical protein